MFEIRMNGRKADAERLTNLIIQQHEKKHHLQKRDTISDFWKRRLLDMQLKDDPIEVANSYSSSSSLKFNKSKQQQIYSKDSESKKNTLKNT